MTVRKDQPVRRNNDAGAGAAAGLARSNAVDYRKSHNGWANPLDDVDDRSRIGVKRSLIVATDGGLRGISPAAQGIA
jgi:hypothetical protein